MTQETIAAARFLQDKPCLTVGMTQELHALAAGGMMIP
jgi:fructoselysine-6-P-deglycase FrlB-like protein